MTNGLADLVLAAYVTVCALAAYRWLEDGGRRWASLSGFAAGAAAWTKLEGALTCLVILAGVLARAPRAAHARRRRLAGLVRRVHAALAAVPADPRHPAQPRALQDALPRLPLDRRPRLPHARRDGPLGRVLAAVAGADRRSPCRSGGRRRYRRLAALTLPNLVLTLGAYVTHYRAGEAGQRRGDGAPALPAPGARVSPSGRCRRYTRPRHACARGAATQPSDPPTSPPEPSSDEPASPCRPGSPPSCFAVLTIRVVPAGQDRERRPAAPAARVRAAAAGAVAGAGRPTSGGLDTLSFKRGGGRQILGATVIAVGVLFLRSTCSLSARQDRTRRDLTRLIENLALRRSSASTGHPEQFAGGHRGRHPGLQRVEQHRTT